jgi:hypothetical protein
MMMMMMMMMVFLQSKLSCDECFFFDVSTSGFLSLEKKIERGLRKKYDRHLGRQKKIEIRGATNNNDNNEKGGGRVLLERQCIFLFATQKRIRFRITKSSFLNCFIKKKTFGKASGRKRKRFLPSRANRHQGVCSYLHMMFTSTNHIFL